jgi:hypothetical protein
VITQKSDVEDQLVKAKEQIA